METARLATNADRDVLAELARKARALAFAQRGGPLWLAREVAWSPEALLEPDHPSPPDGVVVLGCVDDVPLGFATLIMEEIPDGRRLAVVDQLYVDPAARDIGIGEAMMELVLDRAREDGAVGIDATALPGDRATKNFFERFGLTARAITVHRSLVETDDGP